MIHQRWGEGSSYRFGKGPADSMGKLGCQLDKVVHADQGIKVPIVVSTVDG